MKDKLLFCDYARAVAMLAVIVHHCAAYYMPGGWFNSAPAEPSLALGFFAAYLNTFHVFVFTFVSGYIFQYLKFEHGKYNHFGSFAKNKFLRLLVPYAFVAMSWCAPFHAYFFNVGAEELIRKFVLGYSPAQLWYILMLFVVFMMVFPLAERLQSLSENQTYVAALIIYVAGLGIQIFSLPFEIAEAVRQMAFFVIGMSFRRLKIKMHPWYFYALAHLILFIGFYQLLSETSTLFKAIRYSIQPFISLLGVFMIVGFISEHQDLSIWKKKIFNLFSANSFTIYLFHQQIIYCVIARFDGFLSPLELAVVNLIAALIFSSLICLILNRFAVTRFLIGQK